MTLTADRPDDLERRLRERASRHGRAVEEYVRGLIEEDASRPERGPGAAAPGLGLDQVPALSDVEFETLLDELASGPPLPHLPTDFSRADIYDEHD